MSKPGRPVVISAASGTGKSTIIKKVLQRDPELAFSISATTREPRAGEKDGVNYHFISDQEFERGISEGRFLEWEIVHGKYYGTERVPLENLLKSGKYVILDLDVNGGKAIKKACPEALLIFIHPPSLEELTKRLKERGTDTTVSIAKRLERYPMEITEGNKYPFHVMNDSVKHSVERVLSIIKSNGKQSGSKFNDKK